MGGLRHFRNSDVRPAVPAGLRCMPLPETPPHKANQSLDGICRETAPLLLAISAFADARCAAGVLQHRAYFRATGERDPDMHQAKKGSPWHFWMKAHIDVDAESGPVHSVVGAAASVTASTAVQRPARAGRAEVMCGAAADQGPAMAGSLRFDRNVLPSARIGRSSQPRWRHARSA